jgi:hypothetical protein
MVAMDTLASVPSLDEDHVVIFAVRFFASTGKIERLGCDIVLPLDDTTTSVALLQQTDDASGFLLGQIFLRAVLQWDISKDDVQRLKIFQVAILDLEREMFWPWQCVNTYHTAYRTLYSAGVPFPRKTSVRLADVTRDIHPKRYVLLVSVDCGGGDRRGGKPQSC